MASTLRAQPELDPPSTPRNGRGGANGSVGAAAYDGPLPEASFTELIRRLINDVSDLADKQVELAKQEIGEAKDQAIGAILKLAIGAGIALVAALFAAIWLWTAVIWFFNWLGAFISIGPITLAWLGWVVGIALPALGAFIAWKRFISGGISQAKSIWPPLPKTRDTLKEDLEWVRHQRIPSAR